MIEIRDLWKRFGGRAVLRGVSLSIGRGERVALVGPNGSGKTTLLRCLLGLLRAEGTIAVGGFDPVRDHVAAQASVVYVPQRAPALPSTVGEVVAFWSATRREPAERLVREAMALGLDVPEVRGRRFAELSGGMQQKLLAATALATSCPVLLLDEPTANLDPPARAAFFAALAAREPAPTVVLSSHRLEELRELVDRVVVLEDGKVAFDDRLDQLLADPVRASRAGVELEPKILAFRRKS